MSDLLIDPDCRNGKCASCVGGPCQHECHGVVAPNPEHVDAVAAAPPQPEAEAPPSHDDLLAERDHLRAVLGRAMGLLRENGMQQRDVLNGIRDLIQQRDGHRQAADEIGRRLRQEIEALRNSNVEGDDAAALAAVRALRNDLRADYEGMAVDSPEAIAQHAGLGIVLVRLDEALGRTAQTGPRFEVHAVEAGHGGIVPIRHGLDTTRLTVTAKAADGKPCVVHRVAIYDVDDVEVVTAPEAVEVTLVSGT